MTAQMLPFTVFALGLTLTAACSEENPAPVQPPGEVTQGVLLINASTQPVDILVDGALLASGVAPGTLDSVPQDAGAHTVTLRIAGTSTTATLSLGVGSGALTSVAAIRYGSTLGASVLEDTGGYVPAGATKVRVLHLAPNAGEIQVARTQPDWPAPPLIGWKIPFLYDSTSLNDPLANPYYQSTVGTWDVRVWQKPAADTVAWDTTTARVLIPLASGEKRTVVVLDRPGGGIRLSVIE